MNSSLSHIDHTVIMVADLDTSINWYLSSFSCELIHKSKRLAILQFENIKVVLSLPSEQRPHLGIVKEDAASFGEVVEQSDLCHSTFIADPSGNPVELVLQPFNKTEEA
jgi:catechol 2,3-dioxygenase-like lactoylglutathione lyase family enzyme